MKKLNIRKDDTVVMLSGKDKGKKGKVIAVLPEDGKIVVEKVNVISRHTKPRQQGEEGGIIQREAPFYACKAQVVCPKCGKGVRVAHKVETKTISGKSRSVSVRVCKKCGAEL